ncbi:helix-turn-helix domain-containing protein [Senegalimassilia anaerobia]
MLYKNRKSNFMPSYSRKIKDLREKRGLTQKQLGAACGISESAMRSYELGARKPKKEALERIAMELKVRPEYLTAPDFESMAELFYALFENDDLMGHTITEINGKPAITGGGMTVGIAFSSFLKDWSNMKKKLDAKEISQEEYDDWKQTYDPDYWMNTADGKNPWTGN